MIGIVGGTFDPVHNGHICPVHRLTRDVAFVKVHYVLSARPPHRDPPSASVRDRYTMLELALEPYPLFEADDQEIDRPGPSYTIHTLINLRHRYKDRPLCLILGLDAFQGLKSWYRWQEISKMVNLLVLSRPGWKPDDSFVHGDLQRLCQRNAGLVMLWNGVEMPFSSTEIRRRLGAGEAVSEQVPEKVLQYIYANKLYGANRL